MTLATLRAAAASWSCSNGRYPVAGDDLSKYLGERRWWRAALEAGALREDGVLTELGVQALAGALAKPVLPSRSEARKAESHRAASEASSSPFARVVITEKTYTLAKAKVDIRAIYAGRAARSLVAALRRWSLMNGGAAPVAGIEFSGQIRGRVRYWTDGANEGWVRMVGSVGLSNDCGARPECKVYLTEKGAAVLGAGAKEVLELAAAADKSFRDPRNITYVCCGHLKGPDDLYHAPNCPAMQPDAE